MYDLALILSNELKHMCVYVQCLMVPPGLPRYFVLRFFRTYEIEDMYQVVWE